MIDQYGRTINYLRISLTDQCNLRCVYCMPERMVFRPREELLSDGEVLRLAGLFAGLGVRKIRFTGGEPTLRPTLPELVRGVASIEGIEEIAMTTNAIRLAPVARELASAGLDRVNISLDTIDPETFRIMARRGRLKDVWQGISAAEEAGLTVKLNAVVVRNLNDAEKAVELARLTLQHNWQVRFIEMMPFGGVSEFQQGGVVTEDELVATFEEAIGPLTLLDHGELDGEARRYQFANAPGTLGFISPVTRPFCAGCNRVRLTADGKLRLCLLRERELDLREPLRSGALDEEISQLVRDAVWEKPWGHGLAENQFAENRTMSEIGG